MRALVTGATGFVGQALVRRLLADGHAVVAVARTPAGPVPDGAVRAIVPGLSGDADWRAAVAGVDTVFHLAARVHVMHDTDTDPLAAFRRVNVEGTARLARQAADAGVKRFVFVSSIKVNGETTAAGRPFTAQDAPAPVDPYGISKLEAEQALRALCADHAMELVVVRPPLVYGPGVKANFLRMMQWLQRGIPLPFGAIDNRRSLVALDNLVDLLAACGRHPGAAGRTFLAADGEDLSTTELLRRLGLALGRPARIVPVPGAWLRGALVALGKRDLAQRLCGSLQVDIGEARTRLAWNPPIDVTEGLRRTARAFLTRPD